MRSAGLMLCASVSVLFNFLCFYYIFPGAFLRFQELKHKPNSSMRKEAVTLLNCNGIACTTKPLLVLNIYSEKVVLFLKVINVGFLRC